MTGAYGAPKKCADCKHGKDEDCNGICDEEEEGGDEMAGGNSDEDEDGGDEMAGRNSDEDEDGGDEMAGGNSDEDEDGGDEMAGGNSDEDEEGGDEMAGGNSDEDEDGGDEMAGGNSDEDEEGGDEMAGGTSKDILCEDEEDDNVVMFCDENEEGGEEDAMVVINDQNDRCKGKRNKKRRQCQPKPDDRRFEYTKQIYEEYLPYYTPESYEQPKIILQTVPQYSFRNYYTLNKHNHHHFPQTQTHSSHDSHIGTAMREHLPLEIPETSVNGYSSSQRYPPSPSNDDLFERLKSLPTLYRYPSTNDKPYSPVSSVSYLQNHGITENNQLHLNGYTSSPLSGDPILGHNLQDIVDVAPKKYYSVTKQGKNLYSSSPLFPSGNRASMYHSVGYGNEPRQPKSYNSRLPTSVIDKLPPISITNHGAHGIYSDAPTAYDSPPPELSLQESFPFGNYGADPDDILPHLLPPHMHIFENSSPSPKNGYQSNTFSKRGKELKPLVRFQYIHHSGHQGNDESDENEEQYPAYKIPGPPYQHHSVPLEKQKKRKGKLFKFSNILKRLLGR